MGHVDDAFLDRLNQLGPALLGAFEAFEHARRRLHPPRLGELRDALQPIGARLSAALAEFGSSPPPPGLEILAGQLAQAGASMEQAVRDFCSPAQPQEAIPLVLAAMHRHCRAQALLYPLRRALPPVSRYFVEAPFRDRLDELDPERAKDAPVGIFQVRDPSTERGGFWLYVPESYDGTPWPLVVALHGGSGTGADFLWSWLSEARGRRFLLMAPTSLGSTWSLMGDDVDAPALRAMVDYVREGWKVDPERILLTGLSDGATYALLAGLQEGMPFTAFAPVSGVLHPANAANGNLQRARGRRILIVHGALDWMFPVALARLARDDLAAAGADVLFREVPDLSHTYPRDENDRILTWFDPSLALPRAAEV